MFWNMLKATVAASWAYHMHAASSLVAPVGMPGADPLLGGCTVSVAKRVAYTVVERVSDRCPSVPHASLVRIDSVFELRSSWR